MLPQNSGQLLFNAVRETLETMAFAEVVPCSIKVGGEECTIAEEPMVNGPDPTLGGWGDVASDVPVNTGPVVDTWGTAVPDTLPPGDDPWGTVSDEPLPGDSPDSMPMDTQDVGEGDSWGDPVEDDDWGHRDHVTLPEADPWGEAAALEGRSDELVVHTREADFDNMVTQQDDWCWACMKVNSPDIHSVWLVISRGLANALATNMYAGEDFQLDNPLIRDLISELTNVFGGKLMLLLEEMGGKFTLTVPEIGFGMPQTLQSNSKNTVVCKVVVDGEYPVIVALGFN